MAYPGYFPAAVFMSRILQDPAGFLSNDDGICREIFSSGNEWVIRFVRENRRRGVSSEGAALYRGKYIENKEKRSVLEKNWRSTRVALNRVALYRGYTVFISHSFSKVIFDRVSPHSYLYLKQFFI